MGFRSRVFLLLACASFAAWGAALLEHVPLHLASPVPDALDARIPPDAPERQIRHKAHAAMNP